MATVIWTDKAKAARRKLYVEGVINFGIFTALKVVRKIESITDELEYFPELGYREPLLEGKNDATIEIKQKIFITNRKITIMRNIYLITAALASMILASCANEEIVGNEAGTGTTTNGVISFGGLAPAMTRADLYGGDAATKLGSKFVVYGTKHTAAEDKTAANDAVVFNNFQVEYTASTAGTTASNSSDWEYVGKQAYNSAPASQGIKYWDYSATQGYTFYAFSSSNISYPANTSDLVSVTKVTADETSLYNKGYEVTIKDASKLSNLYFSDRVEVPKADYDKTVDLTFRNIGTKVRFGFYETIPGYKVTIDEFLIDADASAAVTSFAAMKDKKVDGFYASLQNVKTSANQTINVTYYDNTDEKIKNQPKVSNPTGGFDYYIKLGDASTIINKELATTSSAPTWVNGTTDNGYTTVFPFEGNTNPLLVKLNFTLTAEDGSGDVIHVKGARAIIPAKYVQWKGNFAYTYIFKIFDKTNGTTGTVDGNGDPTDPEGLKPITFDAIVVDITDERQEAITSVSTNSITTYAEGKIVNEYTKGKPIYVSVTDNGEKNATTHPVITPSAIGAAATQAQIYSLDKAASEAEVFAQLTGSPMGITMTAVSGASIQETVPLADGTTAAIANVKFTPDTAGTYAYVYTRAAYVAPEYLSQAEATSYDSSKTYYMKTANDVYYAVVVTSEAAFNEHKAQLYLIDPNHAGTPGVYDIKVIKVQ